MSGFCQNCGCYLKPDESEMVFIDGGGIIETCRDCKKIIYHERIEAASIAFFGGKNPFSVQDRGQDAGPLFDKRFNNNTL